MQRIFDIVNRFLGRENRHPLPAATSPYPWLVFTGGGNKKKTTTFYDISQQKKIGTYRLPQKWFASDHGWLILIDNELITLWNPVSLESIALPTPNFPEGEKMKYGVLMSPPENPDSVLVVFAYEPLSIWFCRINEDDRRWVRRDCSEEIQDGIILEAWSCRPIVCNGRIYAFSYNGETEMVEIEIVRPHRVVIRPLKCSGMPDFPIMWDCPTSVQLIEVCGDIFCIQFGFGGVREEEVIHIVIGKLDVRNQVWKQVKTFPDKVFFCDQFKAYCCPAESGNKMFFTHYRRKMLYTYNVKEQSITTAEPYPGYYPTWLLPEVPSNWETPVLQELRSNDYLVDGLTLPIQETLLGLGDEENEEEEEEESVSLVASLPVDIFLKIVTSHLGPFDYMNFRAASRMCRSKAPKKQWRLEIPEEMQSHISSPWLMLPATAGNENASSIVDPKLGGEYKCYLKKFPQDANVCYCRHGWLLMAKDRKLLLYNPLTKGVICLPYHPYDQILFLSPPDSSDCIVVGLQTSMITLIRPRIMREWKHVEVSRVDEPEATICMEYYYSELPNQKSPVFIDDTFFFLGHKRNLFAMTIFEPDQATSFRALKMEIPCSSFYEQSFLVVCDGELLAVIVGAAGQLVEVFKLNRAQEVWDWNEVNDLGDKCLYLSNSSSFAIKSKNPNRIYFTRFYGESVVYFSMKTRKLQYSSVREGRVVEESLDNFCGSKEHLLSCWFEPRWHMKEPSCTDPASSVMLEKLNKHLNTP